MCAETLAGPSDGRSVPLQEAASLLLIEQLDARLYLLRLAAPGIASAVQPGQFVHMRVPGMPDRILRRPFGIYDADTSAGTIDVLFQVVGKGTAHLATLAPGASFDLLGPLGHGWTRPEGLERALVVAGGAGAAPLYLFTGRLLEAGTAVDVVLGAQTASALVMRERFSGLLGCEPACSTDDGSYGYRGFATGPTSELLGANVYGQVYCCGPEPMMRAVAQMAADVQVPCQVSLEKRMACGIGACLSCVVDTVDGRRRSCVDGPVFPAEKVVW